MEHLGIFFPHLVQVAVDRVLCDGDGVPIQAGTTATSASCPMCQIASARVHSRYVRRLADTAIAARPARLLLRVRKFFCDNVSCERRTFAEPLVFAGRYARRTRLAADGIISVALALGGRAGARLTGGLGADCSPSTLLRVIRRIPESAVKTPRVLGVDDFATRRGHRYATVLVDMITRRPVDVLPDREASTFAAWLKAHPGVEIICRDRGGAYAEGARIGAPQAVQVADRFHLWANLGEAVEKTVITHRACLTEPDTACEQANPPSATDSGGALEQPDGKLDVFGRPRRLVQRTTERFETVQALRAQGMSLGAISRTLRLDHTTVRRFAYAQSLDEVLFKATHRVSKLDAFKPYLNQRFNEGTADAAILFAEIQARGYAGGKLTVRRYIAPFRPSGKAPKASPAPPKPRRVAGWIMTDPANLTPGKAVQLKQILARCPELDALTRHVAAFAHMMGQLRGDQLGAWMAAAASDNLPALHSMLTGIRRDLDAVTAGLSLPWSSGAVEGHVNRIKMLKRQMFAARTSTCYASESCSQTDHTGA